VYLRETTCADHQPCWDKPVSNGWPSDGSAASTGEVWANKFLASRSKDKLNFLYITYYSRWRTLLDCYPNVHVPSIVRHNKSESMNSGYNYVYFKTALFTPFFVYYWEAKKHIYVLLKEEKNGRTFRFVKYIPQMKMFQINVVGLHKNQILLQV
jgi:hypothetical protein